MRWDQDHPEIKRVIFTIAAQEAAMGASYETIL